MAGDFRDLEVYKAARELRKRVLTMTGKLPTDERYNLVSQMRRVVLSLTNNIAEGHGSRSWRHNISYLYRSRGSAYELIDDYTACEDQGYFKPEHLNDITKDTERVIMLINGYIRHLRKRMNEQSELTN